MESECKVGGFMEVIIGVYIESMTIFHWLQQMLSCLRPNRYVFSISVSDNQLMENGNEKGHKTN